MILEPEGWRNNPMITLCTKQFQSIINALPISNDIKAGVIKAAEANYSLVYVAGMSKGTADATDLIRKELK